MNEIRTAGLAMMLGVVSMGSSALAAETRVFRAGAAASNITPSMGVRLDGTIMQIGPAKGRA